ncbi:MAG: 8-oxo-dGTP diphosphatase [Candidatus Paceibacteria bacterium]|jgi:8-oxo-dGTP diphosphatase
MWMNRAQHCPLCAGSLALEDVAGRSRPRCQECGWVLFKNPASAAAGVVLDANGRVLLIRRGIEPFQGEWALPAGYQEVDESPEETVRREVQEETGIEVEPYRLVDLVFIPDDPRKPANLAMYLARVVGGHLRAGDDAKDAAWFALDDLPEKIGFGNRERILHPLRDDPQRFGLEPWPT